MEKQGSSHIDEEQLEAYAANRLMGDELDRVEEHLLVCAACQDRLDEVERFGRAMRSASQRIREEEKQTVKAAGASRWTLSFFRIPVPVWAGAAALTVVLAIVVSLPTGYPPRNPSPPLAPPGPPVEVALEALRGESTGTAPAGHALHLRLDGQGVTELPAWRVQIVDYKGGPVWRGIGHRSGDTILADVPQAFSPGTYYVRLIKDSEVDPAREFQLVIQ